MFLMSRCQENPCAGTTDTYRHTDTQTQACTQRHTQMHTHRETWTCIDTHRHRDTHRHTQTRTCTHRETHTDTQRTSRHTLRSSTWGLRCDHHRPQCRRVGREGQLHRESDSGDHCSSSGPLPLRPATSNWMNLLAPLRPGMWMHGTRRATITLALEGGLKDQRAHSGLLSSH